MKKCIVSQSRGVLLNMERWSVVASRFIVAVNGGVAGGAPRGNSPRTFQTGWNWSER